MTYAEKLKDPRWQKKRLEIFNRDNWKCTKCGNDKITLAVHHESYSGNPWEVSNDKLTTICEPCHKKEHKISELKKYEEEIVYGKKYRVCSIWSDRTVDFIFKPHQKSKSIIDLENERGEISEKLIGNDNEFIVGDILRRIMEIDSEMKEMRRVYNGRG